MANDIMKRKCECSYDDNFFEVMDRQQSYYPAVTRHGEYAMEKEISRARLSQQAMANAAELSRLGEALARNNPAAMSALEEIYGNYVIATTKEIREYGKDLPSYEEPISRVRKALYQESRAEAFSRRRRW